MEPNSPTSFNESYPPDMPHEEPAAPMPSHDAPPAPKKPRHTNLIISVVVLAVGALVVLGLTGVIPLAKLGLTGSGNVAAVVNGEKITEAYISERLNQARPTLEQQGFKLDDPAVMKELHDRAVEDLVKETLIIQEAKTLGIEVADEDVSKQYDGIVAGLGGEEKFQAALTANGLTTEKLRADLRRQIFVERFVERFASERSITVADAEIAELHKGLAAQNKDLPPLAEIRESLRNQLMQQKIAEVLNPYLEELRAKAEVKIN